MKTHHLPISLSRPALRLAAGLVAAAVTGTIYAQRPVDRPVVVVNKVDLKNADKNFAEKVAKNSMEEVEVSRVAAERSSNPQVKAFAESMSADHSRMNEELAMIASAKGVSLPAKDRSGEKWMKQNAKGFDHDYLKKMVSDHEDSVKAFQKQATDGTDAELVAFARKHLPAIQAHLQHAKDLERLLK